MKLTDAVLKEALEIETKMRALGKRLSEIKSACKASGSLSTKSYVVSVTTYPRTILKSQQEMRDENGEGFITKFKLLKDIECTSVDISPKASKVKVKYETKEKGSSRITVKKEVRA